MPGVPGGAPLGGGGARGGPHWLPRRGQLALGARRGLLLLRSHGDVACRLLRHGHVVLGAGVGVMAAAASPAASSGGDQQAQ